MAAFPEVPSFAGRSGYYFATRRSGGRFLASYVCYLSRAVDIKGVAHEFTNEPIAHFGSPETHPLAGVAVDRAPPRSARSGRRRCAGASGAEQRFRRIPHG